MYLKLRGRDGNSTVVISACPWIHVSTLEVTWDAPTTRPAFEWFGWPLAKLDRVAAPFVEIDDALHGAGRDVGDEVLRGAARFRWGASRARSSELPNRATGSTSTRTRDRDGSAGGCFLTGARDGAARKRAHPVQLIRFIPAPGHVAGDGPDGAEPNLPC